MKIAIKVPKGRERNYERLKQEERIKIKQHLSEQLGELLKGD